MRLAPLVLALGLMGCATAPPGEIADPHEPMNRQVHAFNKTLDANLLRPATRMAKGDGAPRAARSSANPS